MPYEDNNCMEQYAYQAPPVETKKSVSTYLQLGGGVFIIILLISSLALNFSLLSRASNTPQAKDTISPNQASSENTYSTIAPTSPPPTPAPQKSNWTNYENEFFKLFYPQNWAIEESQYSGGKTITIKPSAHSLNTNISITTESNLLPPTLSERQELYLELGYTKDVTLVNTILAARLRGSVQSESPYQEVRTYFTKGNTTYLIVYQYEKAQPDAASEGVFEQIISGITILK